MPDDGLTAKQRAELSAIVADLEASNALIDAREQPPVQWRDIGHTNEGASFIMPSDDPIEADTHMVLIQEPDQLDDEAMKEPEVYRRQAAWWRRRWIVVSRHAGTRRFWTQWRANRWARRVR